MLVLILLLLIGLILLWVGSDFVIESAKSLAHKLGLSHVFIGLTIVSIGTSLPEIFTNVYSSISNLKGMPASGIAVGINIGSSIGQLTLIVGLVALASTLRTTQKSLERQGTFILFSILLLLIMGMNGFISRTEGIILILAFITYIFILSREERGRKKKRDEHKRFLLEEPLGAVEFRTEKLRRQPVIISLFMLGGLGLLILGSKLVVENALRITEVLNLTQTFTGVIIISVGGFLPELSTALKGIIRKAHGISLGTLIGSNITNPLFSMGLGAVISGLRFNKSLLVFELPFWAFTVLIVVRLLKRNMRVEYHERREGIILVGLYFFFVLMKVVFFRHV